MAKKPSRTTLNNKLDKAYSTLVRLRAGGRCEVCGGPNPQAHHYITRRNRKLRWDPANGIAVCAGHHMFKNESFHKNPVWARSWMRDHREDDLVHLEDVWYEIKKWTIEGKQEYLEEIEKQIGYLL